MENTHALCKVRGVAQKGSTSIIKYAQTLYYIEYRGWKCGLSRYSPATVKPLIFPGVHPEQSRGTSQKTSILAPRNPALAWTK